MEPQKQVALAESTRFYKDLTIINQATKCSILDFAPTTIQHELESSETPSADLSFQIYMHRENVEAVKDAAAKYLEHCLLGGFSQDLGFKDENLYLQKQRSTDQKEGTVLDSLITQNRLFSDDMRREIYLILKQQDSLTIFLKQVPEIFGTAVAREMTFIIYLLLKEKYQKYKQALTARPSLFPKLNCYQYLDDGYRQLFIQTPVFDQISLEDVVAFAEKDLEKIAKNLHSNDAQIKILNLKQVTAEINPKANHLTQFTSLVKQISKSVFLTLAGGIQPFHSNNSVFDTLREISLSDFSEGTSNNRSQSRVHSWINEEERYDFVSKKVKLE